MKEKYDKEGVEFVEDELDIAKKDKKKEGQLGKATTRSGARKPGHTSSGEQYIGPPSSIRNLDGEQKEQFNPFNMVINAAKSLSARRGPPQA